MPTVDCGELLQYLPFTWQQQNSFLQFQLRGTTISPFSNHVVSHIILSCISLQGKQSNQIIFPPRKNEGKNQFSKSQGTGKIMQHLNFNNFADNNKRL
jgi:hypothetical protein